MIGKGIASFLQIISIFLLILVLIGCLSALFFRAKVLRRANVKYRHADRPAYRMTAFRKSQIWVFHQLLCRPLALLPLTRSLFTHENHSRPEAVRLREKGKIKKKFNGLNLRVMPNWCSSAYVIEGDAKEIKSLYDMPIGHGLPPFIMDKAHFHVPPTPPQAVFMRQRYGERIAGQGPHCLSG